MPTAYATVVTAEHVTLFPRRHQMGCGVHHHTPASYGQASAIGAENETGDSGKEKAGQVLSRDLLHRKIIPHLAEAPTMAKPARGRFDGVWGMRTFTAEELFALADQYEARMGDPANTTIRNGCSAEQIDFAALPWPNGMPWNSSNGNAEANGHAATIGDRNAMQAGPAHPDPKHSP